jgi:hypothetical protein
MTLSKTTQKKIHWQRIEDSAIGLSTRGQEALPSGPADVAPIFATARQEFQQALASLNFMVRALVIVAGVSTAVCLGGVIFAAVSRQIFGSVVFTGAGTASLLVLFAKIHSIGRDQAMLALIPTKYELALQFATTQEDRRKLLDRFMDEVSSLRKPS